MSEGGALRPAVPAACSLDAAGGIERSLEFARLLARALVGLEETPDGLRLRFSGAPGVMADLRELTERESACCPFFDFSLRPGPDGPELEVRAPAEDRPLADALFRPLAGRRVLVTRPPEGAGDLVAALRRLGAEPVVRSAIRIRALDEPAALDDALRRLATYDWVVFTSANGVRQVWGRFEALGEGLEGALEHGEHGRSGGRPRLAAIGPGTAAALEARGARPDYVPGEYVAEALAAGLPLAAGARVLLLRADVSRPALGDLLRARGATVEDVAAYRTVQEAAGAPGEAPDDPAGGAEAPAEPPAEPPHAVTFTSPSTVRGYLRSGAGVPEGAAVVCIGPITARAAREAGLRVDAVAESYTVPGLVEALVRHFAGAPGERRTS